MNMAAEEDDDAAKRDKSFLSSVKRRLKHVLSGMFDFSLLKTVAFVPILAAGVLFFFGSLSSSHNHLHSFSFHCCAINRTRSFSTFFSSQRICC